MRRLISETDGDGTTIDFQTPNFIDMRRSRVVVPAGARVTHISATIDGKEVCSAPLDLQPQTLQAYELQMLHQYFDGIPFMHNVPMVVKITASAPVMVEARVMFFTQDVAHKLKPYALRMAIENGGRMMPTTTELHKLLQ